MMTVDPEKAQAAAAQRGWIVSNDVFVMFAGFIRWECSKCIDLKWHSFQIR